MKIRLNSTLPFTPVQLDAKHVSPRRAVGQLHGIVDGCEYRTPVYAFRHGDDDQIHYQIDPEERVYFDGPTAVSAPAQVARPPNAIDRLEWVAHEDTHNYKPYSFLIMNAMTKLVGNWDGTVYHTPNGERLSNSFCSTTLQIIDACVCNRFGLWAMVGLTADRANEAMPCATPRQLGWVAL